MHQLHQDIVILFALSVGVIFIFHRVGIPAILGYLMTGIVAGPFGLALVKSIHEVELLAEVGVVLLLFTIGIEFSLTNLKRIKKVVFLGGGLQVGLSIAIGTGIFLLRGMPHNKSIFFGFLLALSSTAIVMKLINDRSEVVSPQGKVALGVLVFQDIIVVPLILAIPLLAGSTGQSGAGFIIAGKIVAALTLIFLLYRWGVTWILYHVSRTRSNELFILTIVLICMGIAWLTALAELSLALGAFLAGLIVSESEHSHRAIGNIVPFRDLFTSFFFVSIGMLFNISLVLDNLMVVALLTCAAIVVKTVITGFMGFVLGYPLRIQILAGLYLSQVGEFSFVLARLGEKAELLSHVEYQIFLAVSILTMGLTPFLFTLSQRLAKLSEKIPLPGVLKYGRVYLPPEPEEQMKDHMIIIGYGINGRNVAKAALAANIPYLILEMNPETVRHEREKGVPIYYGDATQEEVLKHAAIDHARVVIVVIADPAATVQIAQVVRRMNHKIYLIIRTRFIREVEHLYSLGADEVIPEEYETSIEIFARVLLHYQVPLGDIERLISEIRTDEYGLFRSMGKKARPRQITYAIPEVQVFTLIVEEGNFLDGRTMGELDLRKKYNITVLAIRRHEETISNPSVKMKFLPGDMVFLMGDADYIHSILKNEI